MAKNLFEALQQSAQAPAVQPAQATEQLTNLMRTTSGKTAAPGQPVQENLMESAAKQQTDAQQKQLTLKASLTQQGMDQEQSAMSDAADIESRQFKLKQRSVEQAHANRTRELLDSARAQKVDLSLDKNRALAEDIAASMRLSNDKYITQLQTEGDKRRLSDAASFKYELTNSIFGSNTELLKSLLKGKEALAVSDAEFSKAMANIDIDTALQIANAENRAAATVQMAQGAGGIIEGGAKAYGAYKPTPGTGPSAPTAKEEAAGMSMGSPKFNPDSPYSR